ncbi:2-Hydroxyacid oxidase 1 isoform X2 [Cydia pomonella]|uniref:2-Hydroxyacid oxidase 1 isoform X2 n=1 Tax=Cydia pomonella TaxID=82600 RepID=UPI002ADE91AD|nr:2-Hydroxyacid oxidase 1 isoform X2 [Cydia pomonella]
MVRNPSWASPTRTWPLFLLHLSVSDISCWSQMNWVGWIYMVIFCFDYNYLASIATKEHIITTIATKIRNYFMLWIVGTHFCSRLYQLHYVGNSFVIPAQAEGTIYTLSTIATSSIEEVSEAAPDAIKWFQLYIYNDRDVTKNLVVRAEKAGFKAIALTMDTPLFGVRRADIRNNFTLPPHLRLANFDGHLSTKIQNAEGGGSGLSKYVENLFDKNLKWDDIKWLKSITNLPIVAKGIMRADDAIKAVEAGCCGILVSNHGARQLDGVPATIEVLPEIIEAVKSYDVEVYLDGGVTTGTDVYKALALGARMVFVGRPALWGLTVGGQAGVQKMLQILRTELQFAVQIAGTPTISDITKDMVCHHSVYSKL